MSSWEEWTRHDPISSHFGVLYDKLNRLDEARYHLEAALRLARELRSPRFEGQCLGYLALVHARQFNVDEARRCLDAGEQLLRITSNQRCLGVLLCNRVEVEHLAGSLDAARASFAQAKTIADASAALPTSKLGIALARVEKLIEAALAQSLSQLH